MPLELLTLKDLQEFKVQLFEELGKILAAYEASQNGNLLKSKDVCRKLMMSPGKLLTCPPSEQPFVTVVGNHVVMDKKI
jgi:hypothetical protein